MMFLGEIDLKVGKNGNIDCCCTEKCSYYHCTAILTAFFELFLRC